MKGMVTIPKWVYAILLAGAILNILNFVSKKKRMTSLKYKSITTMKGSDPSSRFATPLCSPNKWRDEKWK